VSLSERASRDPKEALQALLDRSGLTLDEIGKVESVRLSDYQSMIKNDDGEAQVIDLHATSLLVSPQWAEGPAWEPPSPRRVRVTYGGQRLSRGRTDGLERLLVVPDTQVHYRMVSTGTRSWDLDPFHDLGAMATTVFLAREERPDHICMVGDGMDLPQFGKYMQEASAAEGFNAGLEDMHAFLAALRGVSPVDYIEGNHDLRMSTWALTNARQSYGIKRAKDPHGSWPTMTVPFLLSLDELDVNYVTGYPAGYVDYGPRLRAVHGAKVKETGIHADEGRARCVVHGHTHRVNYQHFRHQGYDGPIESWVGSPGCLVRTDGQVPGVSSGTDPRTRRSVDKAQNWHQGLAMVTYSPDDPSVMPRWEHIPIVDGAAYYRDKVYTGTWTTDRDDRPVF
jgi:hypothetical protein